jgi:SAM-dependent methyltransferase
MFYLILYLLLVVVLFIFLICFSIYTLFLIYSSIKGSPFVATNKKKIINILKLANLKKNKLFYDLGCGDGRVVITAVEKFQVNGVGIDVNPLLIKMAKIKAKISNIPSNKIKFYRANILKYDFSNADYIYLFLMPELINKLKKNFTKLKKGAIIISHGFKIEGWDNLLVKKIEDVPFPTYYYKV